MLELTRINYDALVSAINIYMSSPISFMIKVSEFFFKN